MYADDIILLSPSLCGLQCLVGICSDYANNYDLVFNVMTIINRYAYCEPLAEILNFQYHMLVYIADKYNGGSKCNIVSSIYRHCADLCYL